IVVIISALPKNHNKRNASSNLDSPPSRSSLGLLMKQQAETNKAENRNQHCVLLVEDDRAARRYLEIALHRSGYEVITANDGLEAMKLALSSRIDVVITDAVMPNLSGQELARFMRNNPQLQPH